MGHWSEPPVNIPHIDLPVGMIITLQNRHGLTTFERQANGTWEAVAFDETRGTNIHKKLDNEQGKG